MPPQITSHSSKAEKVFPSFQMLENIASALDVSAVDLFDKKSLAFPVNEDLRKKLLEEICSVVNSAFDETMTASA